MTADLVDMADYRPHIAGPVVCTRCHHHWVAVRPVGTDLMECPSCHAMRGANLDTMLDNPQAILSDECCGQKDSDGVCMAPACLYGDALRLIHSIRVAYHLEHGGPNDDR